MLASEDGRVLIHARYAIRHNQRSFLKATLPPSATLWSASVGGRPIRPGAADQNAVLLPLEKGRVGEEAPTFVVSLVYAQRTDPWRDKSRARIALPAVDLPVSRTGLELHYSPRFRVEAQPGAFRVDTDPGPFADALRTPPPPSARPAPPPASRDAAATTGLQALVDRYRNEGGGRATIGTLPVPVEFPEWGASVFFASELTAESNAPALDLLLRRASK